MQHQSLSSLGHYTDITYNGNSHRNSIDYFPSTLNRGVVLPKLTTNSMDSLAYSTDPAQPLQPLVPINMQTRTNIFPNVYNKSPHKQSWACANSLFFT